MAETVNPAATARSARKTRKLFKRASGPSASAKMSKAETAIDTKSTGNQTLVR